MARLNHLYVTASLYVFYFTIKGKKREDCYKIRELCEVDSKEPLDWEAKGRI